MLRGRKEGKRHLGKLKEGLGEKGQVEGGEKSG